MKKTIELDKNNIEKVKNYGKDNGIKTFTGSIQAIVKNFNPCTCENEGKCKSKDDISDDNFALLSDAILELDKKLDILLSHIAPKSAGEVK